MCRRFLLICVLFTLHFLTAKSQDTLFQLPSFLEIQTDNDYYFLFRSTDRYYTSGNTIKFQNQKLGLGKFGLQHLFPFKKITPAAINTYAIHLEHQIFTAGDIQYSLASEIDRPYAGLFQISIHNDTHSENFASQFHKRLHLGWVGPATLGKEIQDWYHRLTGWPLAKGWSFQIKDQFVYGFSFQWRHILGPNPASKNLRFSYQFAWKLTNIQAHLETGLQLDLGARRDIILNKKGWSAGLWIGLNNNWVWWNQLIEGQLIKQGNISGYQKPIITNFLLNGEWGFLLRYNQSEFSISQHILSPEFKGGGTHYWGSIKFRRYF